MQTEGEPFLSVSKGTSLFLRRFVSFIPRAGIIIFIPRAGIIPREWIIIFIPWAGVIIIMSSYVSVLGTPTGETCCVFGLTPQEVRYLQVGEEDRSSTGIG